MNLYTHECYLKPIEDEEKRKRRQRKCKHQDHGEHMGNRLCAEGHDDDEQFLFEGENCVESFWDWVRELTMLEHGNREWMVIWVVHNFQGYACYFVLDGFYKQKIYQDQIVNEAKILSTSVDNLNFIDSMCFLQMPLSGFTKALGLRELKKGFFPHFFNTAENQDYVGEFPSKVL